MRKNNVFLLIVIIAIAILLYYFRASAEPLVDNQPPKVLNLKFTPKVVNSYVGTHTVHATVQVIDDVSGMKEVGVIVAPIDFEAYPNDYIVFGFSSFDRISGTPLNGVYRTSFIVPQGSAPGPWVLQGISARDNAGNERFYVYDCRDQSQCIDSSNESGFYVLENFFIPFLGKGVVAQ